MRKTTSKPTSDTVRSKKHCIALNCIIIINEICMRNNRFGFTFDLSLVWTYNRRQRALWTVSQERRSRFLADRRLIGAVEGIKSLDCHTWWRRFDDRSPWSNQWLVCPMHQTFRWPPARNERHRWYFGTCDTFLSLRLPQQNRLRRCMLSRDTSQSIRARSVPD